MSAEHIFSQKDSTALRARFNAQQSEAYGQRIDDLDLDFYNFLQSDDARLIITERPTSFDPALSEDSEKLITEPTPDDIPTIDVTPGPRSYDHAQTYSSAKTPLGRRFFAMLAGTCLVVSGVGYCSKDRQADDARVREYGHPDLQSLEALTIEGVCTDELQASARYQEGIAQASQPESVTQRNHRQAAERFGAAALLAEQHHISCTPTDSNTWNIASSLTPHFDVYTLDLTGQCPSVIEAKQANTKPDDHEAALRLRLQWQLSNKHQINCD